MPGQDVVQPARALRQRGEAVVAGGEADAGADGGNVVQVVPDTLQLEQDRPGAPEIVAGTEAERLLAGVGVGDAVRDIAGGAGTRHVGEPFLQRLRFSRTFEAAVLVEELHVEVEDAVADEMEAEVAGLDDAGVDRPDCELVDVVAAHWHPALERRVVVEERPQGLVASKADPMQVVGFALVPAGGWREVDDRGDDSLLDGNALQAHRPVESGQQGAHEQSVGARVQAGEARAFGKG